MAQQKLTKNQYITWAQECSGVDCDSIEDLGDGFIYCKILSSMYPASLNISEATGNPSRADYGANNNFQLVQRCFKDLNIPKQIDINSLLSKNADANLDFAQWFYATFSPRMKVVKCLEAAKLVRNLKKAESEDATRIYLNEAEKEKQLLQTKEAMEAEEATTQALFETEEVKAREAEDAMKVATDIASSIKEIVEDCLNEEVKEAALTTKVELYGDEEWEKSNKKDHREDPVLAAINETVSAREYAVAAIRALAEQHALAVKSSKAAKRRVDESTAAAKEQSLKTEKLKHAADLKATESKKANDAVKHAKFAIAVLDAYENADTKVQGRVQKDAVTALKRAEEALDAFDVVKHTSSNLRTYTGEYIE